MASTWGWGALGQHQHGDARAEREDASALDKIGDVEGRYDHRLSRVGDGTWCSCGSGSSGKQLNVAGSFPKSRTEPVGLQYRLQRFHSSLD